MMIPECPSCGGSSWESIEDYGGGSKRYELRAHGWTLVDDWLDLSQTDYRCLGCGFDPSDDEDNDALWEVLNDIHTARAAEESRPLAMAASLQLWPDRTVS